jgi:hypothetical protein
MNPRFRGIASSLGLAFGLAAGCGGESPSDGGGNPDSTPAPRVDSQLTETSPLLDGCAAPLDGTNFRNAEVHPHIAADPANRGRVVAVYQQDRWSAMGSNAQLTLVSDDFGETWTAATPPRLSACTGGAVDNGGDFAVSTDSWAAFGPNGTAFQVAMAINADYSTGMLVSRSTDGGMTWSDATTLIREGGAYFNDRPTVTADPGRPGTAYVVWDRSDERSTADEEHWYQPLYLATTSDDGVTWSEPRLIHDPGKNKGTIGAQLVVLPDGTLVVGFQRLDALSPLVDSSFAVIRSSDGGETWSDAITAADVGGNGAWASIPSPDGGEEPDLRNASLPLMAVAPDGALHGVWPDNRFDLVDGLHLAYATSTDGGLTWSEPIQIDRTPKGASALVPQIAVGSDGTVGITYYDLRDNDAAPGLPANVWLTTCRSGCGHPESWSETHLGGPFDARGVPSTSLGYMMGDYTGLVADGDRFLAVFALGTGDEANRTDLHSVAVDAP